MARNKDAEFFRSTFAQRAAASASAEFMRSFDFMRERCESPIEEAYLAALVYFTLHEHAQVGDWDCFHLMRRDYVFPEEPDPYDGIHVYLQADVGEYRADFLFRIVDGDTSRFLVVECDGHDFHERTKEQAARDRSRDRWMTQKGITVIRFTGSEIWRDPFACAENTYDIIIKMMGIDIPE